jgi:hypothetical protein
MRNTSALASPRAQNHVELHSAAGEGLPILGLWKIRAANRAGAVVRGRRQPRPPTATKTTTTATTTMNVVVCVCVCAVVAERLFSLVGRAPAQ